VSSVGLRAALRAVAGITLARSVSCLTQWRCVRCVTLRTHLILNADHHEFTRLLRTRVLTDEGYRVIEAATAVEAREHSRTHPIELTLLDLDLPAGLALDVCRTSKANRPFAAVIMISSAPRSRSDALAAGADAYLIEPVPAIEIVAAVRGFLGRVSGSNWVETGWVITDPAGLIEAASQGMKPVLNLAVRTLIGRRLVDYFEDRDVASSLLREAVAGHGDLRPLRVRPRERAPVSSTVQTSAVPMPGDSLLHVRWAFSVAGQWRRVARSVEGLT
jgi:CheY-like chemotaxis protein